MQTMPLSRCVTGEHRSSRKILRLKFGGHTAAESSALGVEKLVVTVSHENKDDRWEQRGEGCLLGYTCCPLGLKERELFGANAGMSIFGP